MDVPKSSAAVGKIKCLSSPVLITYNINRLCSKISKLKTVIDAHEDVCGIAVQETYLNNTIDDLIVNLEGFTIHRVDRNHTKKKEGGGAAIYIRNDWCPKEEQCVIEKIANNNIDLIAVKCRRYVLISVYVNCIRNDKKVLHVLNSLADSLCDDNVLYILGDFNRISFRKNFLNACMTNIVNFPTRDGVQLDQIWTNDSTDVISSVLCKMSDHNGVICRPKFSNRYKKPKKVVRNKIRVIDHDRLKCEFETTEWNVLLEGCFNVDEKNSVISSYIKYCYDLCSSWERIEIIDDKLLSNVVIKHARRKREQCFRKNDNAGFNYWHEKVYFESRRISSIYLKKLKSMNKNKQYWSELKSLADYKKTDVLNNNDIDLDKLNNFFLRFERCDVVSSFIVDNDSIDSPVLSVQETCNLLKRNKNKNSCGNDNIPPWILKQYALDLSYPLCSVYNDCLKNKKIPVEWKCVKVTPLPKPNTSHLCVEKRFRPIGNNSSLSKTLEYFMLDKINEFVNVEDANQFAYKKGLSPSDAVNKLISKVLGALDSDRQCVVRTLFLDFSSAFNTICRKRILEIISKDAPSWLTYLMKDYFSGVIQLVKLGKMKSKPLSCNTGVIQGSICAPLCFTLVTSSIEIEDDVSLLIKFSDDFSLTFVIYDIDGWNTYTDAVNRIEKWTLENNLLLNPTKTQELVFLNPNVKNDKIIDLSKKRISLNGVVIVPSSSVKYLGVQIDSKLIFSQHIDKVYKKCFSVSYYAIKLLRHISNLAMIRDFVDVCILPLLTYAIPCFVGFIRSEDWMLVRRILRRLAAISGRNKEEYTIMFVERIKKMTFKFASKYQPGEKKITYNLRKKINHTQYNKAVSQKLTSYIVFFRPNFFDDLIVKLT